MPRLLRPTRRKSNTRRFPQRALSRLRPPRLQALAATHLHCSLRRSSARVTPSLLPRSRQQSAQRDGGAPQVVVDECLVIHERFRLCASYLFHLALVQCSYCCVELLLDVSYTIMDLLLWRRCVYQSPIYPLLYLYRNRTFFHVQLFSSSGSRRFRSCMCLVLRDPIRARRISHVLITPATNDVAGMGHI